MTSINCLKLLAIGFCGASVALSTGFSASAQAQTSNDSGISSQQLAQGAPSIIDIAMSAGAFDTLVAALKAADLVDALSGDGPLTVFAPTDDAFSALPNGVLDALLQPENKDLLTQILVYHVVEGGVLSSDLSTGDVETMGGDLMVDVSSNGVMVNQAKVLRADIQGSNGVIHVIDQVLVPEAVGTELASRLSAAAEPMAGEDMSGTMTDDMANDMAGMESGATMAEPMSTVEAGMETREEPEFSAPAPQPVRGLW